MTTNDEWLNVTAAMLRRCSEQIGTLTERLAGLDLTDKLTDAGKEVDDIRTQLACLGESLKEATVDARRQVNRRHDADCCCQDCLDPGPRLEYQQGRAEYEFGF